MNKAATGFLGTIINNEQYQILFFDQKLKDHLIRLNHSFKRFIEAEDIIGIRNLIRRESSIGMQQSNLIVDHKKYSLLYLYDLSIEQELSRQIKEISEEAHLTNEILNQMKEGILVADEHKTVLFVNHAFCSMLDIAPSAMIGENLEQNEFGREYFQSVLTLSENTPVITAFHNGRKCLVACSPVYDELHNIKRLVLSLQDISDLAAKKVASLPAEMHPLQKKQSPREDTLPPAMPEPSLGTKMRKIYEQIQSLCNVDSTILLTGETGVGKDYIASYIHQISNRAKTGRFVKINCGAIPEQLLESELFGYEDGAFTGARHGGKKGYFENANNGTLYLDEIGEMPYLLQVKLLSALNDREFYRVGGSKPIAFTARVIAATNADLPTLIKEKKFRSDLYYRINVITFEIPPLRNRKEEILGMAKKMLKQFNTDYSKNFYFAPQVMSAFLRYNWGGNIREMKNLIERLVLISKTECIGIENLPENICQYVGIDLPEETQPFMPANYKSDLLPAEDKAQVFLPPENMKLKEMVEHYEANILEVTLANSASLKEAAEKLGIDISTIVRKKQKYNIL